MEHAPYTLDLEWMTLWDDKQDNPSPFGLANHHA